MQALDAALGRVADDQRRVDSTDGSADNPVGLDAGFVHRFIDTRLVGAQRAAPLQHQHDLALADGRAVITGCLGTQRRRDAGLARSFGHGWMPQVAR